MGEARKRGTKEGREKEAIARNKRLLLESLGIKADAPVMLALQSGLKPFLDRLSAEEWRTRRKALLDTLRNRPEVDNLKEAKPVRVQKDEMAWYMFLCEQELTDPLCNDVSQAQRILPIFQAIGTKWKHSDRITGMDDKLDEMLTTYRNNPDGHMFELLVALSYAEEGWKVAFIPRPKERQKSPDLHVRRGDREFFVECKRLARVTQYSEVERNQFLRLWDKAGEVLLENGQWIWFKGTFHVEPETLPDDFLLNLWKAALPLQRDVQTLLDNDVARIDARLIDKSSVCNHLNDFRVKAHSPMLTKVIGGDWAPENSAVTMIHEIRPSILAGCEADVLGTFVEEVTFACGFTREFDSEISIDKRAKDIKKLLSEAVDQVPTDAPSIIHLAAETMEGAEVERQRSRKVREFMPDFKFDKPVALVRFHRLQAHQRAEMSFELDETVDNFHLRQDDFSHVPMAVAVPQGTQVRNGEHWELYR